jgi:hypothetical protein
MTDYADIYFVDGRNATVDHRPGGHATPGRVVVGQPSGSLSVRAPMAQPASPYGQMPMYPPQGPGYWGPQGWVPTPQGPFGSSLLSRISTGDLIDLIAQVFAALNPLPAQPSVTSDAATDAGNTILYNAALASYAKKDEQIRTLGHLVGKLLG